MTSGELTADAPQGASASAPVDLAVWERLALWEKRSPGTAKELLEILRAERRHAHRLAWADWTRQLIGVLLGFGCVLSITFLAWHYADVGSPLNGAIVMGSGTASVAAIFVTGKYAGRIVPSARAGTGPRSRTPRRPTGGTDTPAAEPRQ